MTIVKCHCSMFERNLSGMASELMLTQSQREQESFRIGQKTEYYDSML